jgi:hypothetical protein
VSQLATNLQGQVLLITVGMAFLIAVVVFGSGIGIIFYKMERMEQQVTARLEYAQDMAEIRHRELERAAHGRK